MAETIATLPEALVTIRQVQWTREHVQHRWAAQDMIGCWVVNSRQKVPGMFKMLNVGTEGWQKEKLAGLAVVFFVCLCSVGRFEEARLSA